MNQTVLLEMQGICKSFPGVKALDQIDLELRAGEVHALLGENGAGKSTLIKILGGIYSADEGKIRINGQDVVIRNVADAERNGISIIHQELVLVPEMTVAENIYLGRERGTQLWVDRRKMELDAQALLEKLNMPIRADVRVSQLSIAEQQMVEITKAVSVDARILVMDEPTSSISEVDVENLFNIIRTLTAKGVGIIYISHKMSELDEICDRVTVMRDGKSIDTVEVKNVEKSKLISMMVGRELTQFFVRDYVSGEEEILRVENLSDGKYLKNLSFELKRGEIVGFAGLVGAGRSETMQALFGLRPITEGSIYIEGKKVQIRTARDAMKAGIALVPENRKAQGLYLEKDLQFNTSIEVLDRFISWYRVNRKLEEEITQHYVDAMQTKTPSLRQKVSKLSGGNQQKVLIGRWLSLEPKILILDEPTRGIDVGAKAEIYKIMNELTQKGVSIAMISHRRQSCTWLQSECFEPYSGNH